jgi:hypothetical protein
MLTGMSSSGDRLGAVGFSFPRSGSGGVPDRDGLGLVAVAEALGIPWERLLEAEIQAERTLRGFVGEPEADLPLWRFLSALPATALDSWRVRERLATLLREARLTHSGAAVRSVREAVDELCGKRAGIESDARCLAVHLALALERVRELARVARAAERCRGDRGECLAGIIAKTGCTNADAEWGLERAQAPGRGHAIDDAVRQARAEGFEIPAADSEFHAFLALRKLARRGHTVRPRAAARHQGRPGPERHPHRLAS